MKSNINPDLEHLARDIKSLTPDPQNVRKHSKRNLQAIADSLMKYGQLKPIVAKNRIVYAGNGTLEAAIMLGWEQIAVTEFVGSGQTGYALADNRTAELAEWDFEKLSNQLSLFENQLELQSLWSPEEILALTTVSEAGEIGISKEEKFEVFKTNAIKQIVLYLDDTQYREVLLKFKKVAETYNLETNTDVVLKLLNYYENDPSLSSPN